MKTPLIAALCVTLGLTACGGFRDSNLNPFNWFGGSRGEARAVEKEVAPAERADPRPLIAQVTDMTIERVPGGALITATGLTPTQGYWNAELLSEDVDEIAVNGVLTYSFRVVPPTGQQPVGNAATRSITVGHFVSDQKLSGVGSIVVRGIANQRVSRR
ncbi:hypothetical protein IV417_04150 [Alphaproteobacteria bacterium KMM 3653]|uniref:Lipoprotein n=1 Tax=Harenicola maris TaxID=2841044 RepID=A0AAP2CN58_9RHOB|nr:hypothetical protein [Harenicola maris]